jgi:hypothetical protein
MVSKPVSFRYEQIDTYKKGMTVKKIVLLIVMAFFLFGGDCWADGYRGSLAVSSVSFRGGFDIIQDMADGFWKAGLSGLYTEDGETEYKWAEIRFTLGADVFRPGLTCEAGLKGLVGKADDMGFSGDVGSVALTGRIGYDFAQQMVFPGSIELYGGVDYANDILSFQDTEDYLSYHFGIGIPLFQHAAVVVEYSAYDIGMMSEAGNWRLEDDAFRVGLSIKF